MSTLTMIPCRAHVALHEGLCGTPSFARGSQLVPARSHLLCTRAVFSLRVVSPSPALPRCPFSAGGYPPSCGGDSAVA